MLEELGNFLGPDGVKARTWQRKLKAVQSELAAAQKAKFALCRVALRRGSVGLGL